MCKCCHNHKNHYIYIEKSLVRGCPYCEIARLTAELESLSKELKSAKHGFDTYFEMYNKAQAQHDWQCEQRMKVEKKLNAVCDELLLATIKITVSQLSK